MGNESENFSKEIEGKAICHSYSSLVDELASRMVVKESVLLTNKKDKFDPEDIFSWIRAVDYKDTKKAPDVQAILSTKQGKETVTFDVRKEATIKSKEEKVTQESLLYSMALTEAKMKMISLQAEEVYPAVAFLIQDYRKAMEKMREEVLENKAEKRSLGDVLSTLTDGSVLPYATALALAVLFLTSCGRNPETTKTLEPTDNQPKITLIAPASTEVVTETPFVETATYEPTATATEMVKVEEHELMPQYTLEVDQTYMGVEIKASLITDASLGFPEAKITLPESTYAQYITRVIYWGWWTNATSETHEGLSTEEDYKRFMKLWATAQTTNAEEDWKKVEFTTFGNDLNDGDGYVQEKMTFWPMHSGNTPEGVTNLDKLTVAILDGTKVENINIVGKDYTQAFGTNIDADNLYVYIGLPMENGKYSLWPKNVASMMSAAPYWLGRRGQSASLSSDNKSIKSFLLGGGLQTGIMQE